MGEDVLQADQPHQDLLVGLLRQRVSDDVELDDSASLLQPCRLVTGSVWCQQIRLERSNTARLKPLFYRNGEILSGKTQLSDYCSE